MYDRHYRPGWILINRVDALETALKLLAIPKVRMANCVVASKASNRTLAAGARSAAELAAKGTIAQGVG
jgi:hypothetical protein